MTIDSALASRNTATEQDWDAAYAEHLPRIYNFFRYRLGNIVEIEDLTALTFEKAWRARHRYRRDLSGFSTWLLTIARNVAVDHFRSARRAAPLEAAAGVASAKTPEDGAALRSDVARLTALLARMPERERELLSLKYGAECTNREIARLTGLSELNVGVILHRAVQSLRLDW